MTEHTYNLATRLRAIACDSLHTFQPGRSTLTAEDLPDIFVTARFATHPWGISAQLWARNSAAALLASAEATVSPTDEAASIISRIRHFRSGNLLWTATSRPCPSPRPHAPTATPRLDVTATSCTPNRALTRTRSGT